MWAYGEQTESGRGCWEEAVCGSESFWMFDGRMIQFFCDSYSRAAANGLAAPYGLTIAEEPHFEEFVPGCIYDTDCPAGATCTSFFWEGTQDGASYANGEACYFHETGVCPSPEQWAYINANYWGEEGTNFSAYT